MSLLNWRGLATGSGSFNRSAYSGLDARYTRNLVYSSLTHANVGYNRFAATNPRATSSISGRGIDASPANAVNCSQVSRYRGSLFPLTVRTRARHLSALTRSIRRPRPGRQSRNWYSMWVTAALLGVVYQVHEFVMSDYYRLFIRERCSKVFTRIQVYA